MNVHADTVPYWTDSASMPRFPKLERDEHVDVVVVGGGITGLTAAYLLTMAGGRVALVERGRCAQAGTGLTSAHLSMVTHQRLTDLVKRVGRDRAQAVWDAGRAGMAQIDEIVRQHAIPCDFAWVPGYLHAPIGTPTGEHAAMFQEDAAVAADLGFEAAFMSDVPFVGGPGVAFANQARIHPRKYLAMLAHAIDEGGGLIFDDTSADEYSDTPLSVTANGHTISGDLLVIATHTPLKGKTGLARATLFQATLAHSTSYVIAGRVERGRIPDALFWDTADPYHYLRIEPRRDHDVVFFGGEDHKTGRAPDTSGCFDRLERMLTSMVRVDVTHRWSGQVVETPDGLPYIGEMAERQFAGTGYSGNGLTFGTLAGMMAADRVLGRGNRWSELFDPVRLSRLSRVSASIGGV